MLMILLIGEKRGSVADDDRTSWAAQNKAMATARKDGADGRSAQMMVMMVRRSS